MKSTITRHDDGTITVTITLPAASVEKARDESVDEMAKHAKVQGFREGKAPRNLVEGRLNPEELRENILKKLLPTAYMEAIQEHDIKPIMSPKMQIDKLDDGEDWVIGALTCELPEVALNDYKDGVKKLLAKSKIIIPGKEEESKKPAMEEIVKVVLASTKVQVPNVLVEQETDRLLSQLLNDVKRLGLSLDQYLGSTKRSPEDLRNEYSKRAEEDIKLEFVLQKIAETEKISVDPKEVDEAVQKAKDPAEKQNLEANKYLLANILRQQKTLDFLMNL